METQGIVIAEAMACGRPVLVSSHGPGPEILGEDGECGWLVDPKNPDDIFRKIDLILSDSALADAMGKKGRQRSESLFGVTACMGKNIEFYKRCAIRP
jgi:glycosyltransferase involved in cell wall biosynthesis